MIVTNNIHNDIMTLSSLKNVYSVIYAPSYRFKPVRLPMKHKIRHFKCWHVYLFIYLYIYLFIYI